ncbi:MAG: hypothetical protein AABX72_01115, partial [Nanoarchaeota archaeon]
MKIFPLLFVVFLLIIAHIHAAGNSIEISDSSDMLEIRENVGSVRETITEVELDMLAGGVVTTSQGPTEYNQYLRFSNTVTGQNTLRFAPVINFTENDDPTSQVGDFLVVKDGTKVNESFFEYELEFEDGFESTIANNTLLDFKGIGLNILGTQYTVVDADIDTFLHQVTLTLLSDSHHFLMNENQIQQVNYNGRIYTIEVLVIQSTPTVTLNVDGQVLAQLTEGQTIPLSDGTVVGILHIIPNTLTGDIVEFYLATSSLKITDHNYTDSEITLGNGNPEPLGYSQAVEISGEPIEEGFVQIIGHNTSPSIFEIFGVKYRLTV